MAERTTPVLAPGAVTWHDNMPAFEQFAFAPALPLEVEIAAHDTPLGTLQVRSPRHSFQEFRGNQYGISVTAIYSDHREHREYITHYDCGKQDGLCWQGRIRFLNDC